jgi:hypothetical protein
MRPSFTSASSALKRHLPAHGIEGGDQHRLRRLVHEQRHPGRGLERLDVAALAADDAALHLLARELHDGRGEVVVRLARQPLHRRHQNALRLAV